MSKETGFLKYTCDRPASIHTDGKKPEAFVKDGNKDQNDWHEVTYKDIYGVDRTYLLCAECYDKYKTMVETFDRDFMSFINGGVQ